jgi:metal-sulfur cluster biosynthetic enzyme
MKTHNNHAEKNQIAMAALKEVYDPEIGINIVDLGLVYRIDFQEEGEKQLEMHMTLTTQFCPMGETILGSVNQTLEETFKDYKVNVNLTFDPPWHPDMISEEGNNYLNG